MQTQKNKYFLLLQKMSPIILSVVGIFISHDAFANWEIIDNLNLSPFIPMILDAFMTVATGGYEFFVGNGTGIIYVCVWGLMFYSIFMYAIKMYFPKQWLEFLGFSGGGDLWNGNVTLYGSTEKILKDTMRAVVAATFLLQVKPIFVTEWLVNPFLRFGSVYTHAITEMINETGVQAKDVECPPDVISQGWISNESCKFLIQPVSDLSHANNQVIKRGFEFLTRGIRGLVTLIPHGGQDFMNVVTGIILIITFVGCNLFMALLIIQGIFNFGMSLILYPFQVLTWVAKPSDKWFDFWPAFNGIIKSLQQLVITMIACSFILCINIAVIHALFRWNTSVFVVAAGGTAYTNLPGINNSAIGFGEHSILWLSAILTFFLTQTIFTKTREQLEKYAPGMTGLYNQTKADANTAVNRIKNNINIAKKALDWIKKK